MCVCVPAASAQRSSAIFCFERVLTEIPSSSSEAMSAEKVVLAAGALSATDWPELARQSQRQP